MPFVDPRHVVHVLLALAVWLMAAGVSAQAPRPFGLQDVQVEAIKLSGAPYRAPVAQVPPALADLGYDAYRKIFFRREAGLWHGQDLLFDVQFFALGGRFRTPVRINIVERGTVTPVRFDRDMFDFSQSGLAVEQVPEDLGFAGFRLHFPLNQADPYNEFMVFLGASYFRVVGRGQQYGISGRGLAVQTGENEPEEFPVFREFWIEKPEPGQTDIVVHALLDSESLSGAYRFHIRPGTHSPVEVRATLFPRREIRKLGIAPMSSMYLQGENDPAQVDDYRPEIHDSDGLAMRTGAGEWIWRPLINPRDTWVSSFSDNNPRGFGMFQRDRDFDHYQDTEANYHARPSLWVEPIGDWGEGVVQLVEIPTDTEIHDNVTAYWVPKQRVERGQRLELAYRLHSLLEAGARPPLDRVTATRSAPGAGPGHRRFLVDFAGRTLPHLAEDQPVQAKCSTSEGKIGEPVVHKVEVTGAWRLFFDYEPLPGKVADLRCSLSLHGEAVTENWVYLWMP